MRAAGHLRPAALFSHDPADDVPAEHVRQDCGTRLTGAEYNDLWFHLGTQDKRTTRAYLTGDRLDPRRGPCALVDPVDGSTTTARSPSPAPISSATTC
jgi:hypothetical protein